MLSIPDWSVTPFAAGRDVETIANEIIMFNNICKQKAKQHNIHFVNILNLQKAKKLVISL